MKKASKILLTISFIFALILSIGCMIAGVIMAAMVFVSPALSSTDLAIAIEEVFSEMEMDVDGETLAWIIKAVIAVVYLILFAIGFVVYLIVAIVAKKGANAKRQGVLIANIVFGFLGSNLLSLIGGILGIIGLKQDARVAARPKSQPQPKPAPAPAPAPAVEQKPEPQPEPEPLPASEDEKEPEPAPEQPQEEKPARTDWYCPNCGTHNTGKFCESCGTKKPE